METGLENIPQEMIGQNSTLLNVFQELAINEGQTKEFANTLENLLPDELKDTTVWLDRLTNKWRYYFGLPIDNLKSEYVWTGTSNHFLVINLYNVMKVAYRNLNTNQFQDYINRLKDRAKHSDVLFEMRPIISVRKIFKKYFEVQGYGIGNKTLDWRVNILGINIVFDVKNRIKSLITHLEEITPNMVVDVKSINPPAPDPNDLFKSVENKFLEKSYFKQLQGVWIQTQIKEHKSALEKYFFNDLNIKRIHFLIISDWKDDAYILARNKLLKFFLKKIFCISESERFVTDEYK